MFVPATTKLLVILESIPEAATIAPLDTAVALRPIAAWLTPELFMYRLLQKQ
jgi:hypothetical protein